MCQNGCPNGRGKKSKNCSFSHWSPFGCPWVHCYCILHSLGIILAPFWVPLGSFLLSFAVPGHHFGTLGPHQNDSQRVQNSMKMNPHTTPAVFIFVEFWSPWASFWHPWAHHYKVFHNVFCSCVRCIMQHSRNRSRTTREPKIQCKRILKPTWQGSFLLNFEFHAYHFGTLAKCNLFLCPLHHAAQ